MKRTASVLACLLVLLVFVAHGGERPGERAPDPASQPGSRPLPPLEEPDVAQEARGFYVLESGGASFSLELAGDRRFVFLSRLPGQAPRRATGTWSLSGSRLALAYTHVDGKPLEGAPVVAVNQWAGRTIELLDKPPSLTGRAILSKRTVLRDH